MRHSNSIVVVNGRWNLNHQEKWLLQMKTLLRHNVPRFIQHITQRGGVSKEEWLWLERDTEDPDYPMGIMARADEYLLFPKDEEIFKKALFVFVKALAIMAFIPEGIRFGNLHFCSKIENFVAVENDEA